MHHADPPPSPGLAAVWLLIAALVALYVHASRRLPGWSRARTLAVVAGGALLLAAFAPPVVAWAHADLRGHMAQHLLLGMFAPWLLTLGAPVTLLLASVPVPVARRLVAMLHSAPARLLTYPAIALVLNVGGMALLYATPLYALSRTDPWLHALVHYHFIVAGYLFCWAIAGTDPAPRRPGPGHRALVLFAAVAAHATLAKLMYVHGWPRGTGAPLEQVQAAARWMYYGGDAAEALLLATLLAGLRRTPDRRASPTGGAPSRLAQEPAPPGR